MRTPLSAEQIRTIAREQFAGMLAIHPDHAEACADGNAPRAGYYDLDEEAPPYQRRNGLAIVSIRGALSQRGGYWWDGHEAIRGKIEKALHDPLVSLVVLELDSPGGVVAGMVDCVEAVQRAQLATGKEIWGYAREHAYSAAYAWAMCATALYLPESGGMGSIGVLSVLLDARKAYEEMGLRTLVVRSGDRKARGMPIEGFDEQTVTDTQALVDKLAGLFFALVEQSRGVKVAALRALEGDTFDGSAAVEKKLADGVLSWDAFIVKAEAAGKKWKMKGIAKALGLAEDASEGEIEKAARAMVERAGKADGIAAKLADVATNYALVTGRMTAGERDPQVALIKAAPVEGATALLARGENSAVAAPAKEPRATTTDGQPPPKATATHEFSAWATLSDADLGKQYGALIASDANGPSRLASADAKLFNRARAAFQQSTR
jgi:ClpP class serine protease